MTKSREALPDELDIEIVRPPAPCIHFVRYEGTAAQLDDEGLVPAGFEWPRHVDPITWESGGLDFRLMRLRPRGFEGSARSWLAAAGGVDNWALTVRTTTPTAPCRAVHEPAQPSSARLAAARADRRFRAFVARVPGLARALGYRRRRT